MVKSTRKNKVTPPKKGKYPCLVEGEGITDFCKVGYHSTNWGTSCFKPYEGKIILENI